MTEKREFPAEVVLSVTSGVLLCKSFSDVHECVEFLLGRPVWTHEFADPSLLEKSSCRVFSKHPFLEGFDPTGITAENCVERTAAFLGNRKTLELTKGAPS